ncbi:hypothetical protein ABT224_11115 [Streptomyces sp. NPDC001584]|uniref:hypothetical protein n=1 Tax=Streptomyces sp. NPDC001584 TaxID=3154521 RepID=UPI00332B2CA6
MDCTPTELRVGDQAEAGRRLVGIAGLCYRHRATRTMILRGGAVWVTDGAVRV